MNRRKIAPVLNQLLSHELAAKSEWRVDAVDLANKIPDITHKFPSHIIPLIQAAVKRTNRESGMNVDLEIEKPRWGKADLIFKKTSSTPPRPSKQEDRKDGNARELPGNPMESFKTMLKEAFSLYHKTFAHIARKELLFLKWKKASDRDRAMLNAEAEAKTWKHIMTEAQKRMVGMDQYERENLEEKTARMLSSIATDRSVIALVASLLTFGYNKTNF